MDALEQARSQLIPLLVALDAELEQDGDAELRAFFDRILRMLQRASDLEDLAGPFMELSTCAFRGFRPRLAAAALIDALLATAQAISHTLSAPAETRH
jgi:hypothetical protein